MLASTNAALVERPSRTCHPSLVSIIMHTPPPLLMVHGHQVIYLTPTFPYPSRSGAIFPSLYPIGSHHVPCDRFHPTSVFVSLHKLSNSIGYLFTFNVRDCCCLIADDLRPCAIWTITSPQIAPYRRTMIMCPRRETSRFNLMTATNEPL